MARGRILLIGVLALLVLADAPFLGTWVVGLALALMLVAAIAAGRGGVGVGIAAALGLLGGLAGAASVLVALRQFAAVPPYDSRAGFAWAAAGLGLAAALGGALVPDRPRLAAALLVLGSGTGFAAINFFNINTLYFVAPPLYWLAAVVTLVAPQPGRAGRDDVAGGSREQPGEGSSAGP